MENSQIVKQENQGPASMVVGGHPPAPQNNAVAIMSSKETQEIQASLVVAKQFPRDVAHCLESIKVSCGRSRLAEQALYSYSRGGTDITGPSIRLAEAIAQHYGNLEFGWREINRGLDPDGVGYSDVVAFAWDLQTNVRRPQNFRVRHWRDTRSGGYSLKDERDIYELLANMAQRRVRACIIAVIPGDIFDEAVAQCETTLKATADTSPENLKKIIKVFAEFKVTQAQIEARIQRKLESITPAQVVQLKKIYSSLKDGMSTPEDWFESKAKATAATAEPVDPFAASKEKQKDAAKPEAEAPATEKQEASAPSKEAEKTQATNIDDEELF